jgi:hypothetical protein
VLRLIRLHQVDEKGSRCEADEEALVTLEEAAELECAIVLEDADCGRFARQHQCECVASAAATSAKQLAELERMIAATKGQLSILG